MALPNIDELPIIIIGGGIAGVAAAAELVESGYWVKLFEASDIGGVATRRNQGWLHSGAFFAKQHPELAKKCYDSYQKTTAFCPESLDPDSDGMIYLGWDSQADAEPWTTAWREADIPFASVPRDHYATCLPRMNHDKIDWAFRLPDRSFTPTTVLQKLTEQSLEAGVEIHPLVSVTEIVIEENRAVGVKLLDQQFHRARLVIVAGGARSLQHFPTVFGNKDIEQPQYEFVNLRTDLHSICPGVGGDPYFLPGGIGLNHLPHQGTSVFGTSRWNVCQGAVSDVTDAAEIEQITEALSELYPNGYGHEYTTNSWAGTNLQAMHFDQVVPGESPLPTVVDFAEQAPQLENLISLFPGRATLWHSLAADLKALVDKKLCSQI